MVQRVLLVDDDPDVLTSTRQVIESAGYAVLTAHHGGEALGVLGKAGASLILLDLMMPVMDGWQLIAELRRSAHARIPVVVLSASHGLAEKAEKLCVQGHLSKPFEVEALLSVLHRFLGAPRG